MIEIVENFMNDHFLNQHVTDPTHKDGNTLDLILTNNPEIMYDMHITEPLKSTTHHFILQIASNLQHSGPGNTEDDQSNTVPPLKTLNFFSEEVNWQAIKRKVDEVDWESEFEDRSPDEMVERILLLSHEISKQHVPERKTRKRINQIPKDRGS